MAQINKPNEYFNTVLYTGNGSTQSISGVNFKPDLVWIKNRTDLKQHHLFDVVRGATKFIESSTSDAEATDATTLSSFDSDGFTLGNSGKVNGSSVTAVSWSWLASNTTASNNDGDVTSTVSANTTSGFSIVKWTAPGTSTAVEVGHGLGVAPKVLITKSMGSGSSIVAWYVYHESLGNNKTIYLNNTDGSVTNSTIWDATTPTSTVFKHNSGSDNIDYVSYCFAEKKGFSKFGSYTGNGSTDGTFVYTGFKPAFVIIKQSDTSLNGWIMMDDKRNTYNPNGDFLQANTSDAEDTSSVDCDFLSNGFKHRVTSGRVNTSGSSYIYMAFAESPLVGTNNIPATAR